MESKKFTRTVEDFTCEKCGIEVRGTGYTNHCPSCLWSKHVDVNPGDRKSTCLGMMEPSSIKVESNEYKITHICTVCGHAKNNKSSPDDNFSIILRLSNHTLK